MRTASIKLGNRFLKFSCKTGNNLSNELVKSALIGSALSESNPFIISTIHLRISGTIGIYLSLI